MLSKARMQGGRRTEEREVGAVRKRVHFLLAWIERYVFHGLFERRKQSGFNDRAPSHDSRGKERTC